MVTPTLMAKSKWNKWAFQWNCVGVAITPKAALVELKDFSVLVCALPENQRPKI